MRVAVVSESFLPTRNGVSTSVAHVLRHLEARGDQAVLVVPSCGAPSTFAGFPVHEVSAVPYRQFPVGLPHPRLSALLSAFAPDVVHVAAPFLLGGQAILAANRMGVPSVAIYQTDIIGYARRNRLRAAEPLARRIVSRIHQGADLTLAPSNWAIDELQRLGVPRVGRWARGVDLQQFHPRHRASPASAQLRRELLSSSRAGTDATVVGYVGRLAPEKAVERLAQLRRIRDLHLVVVGDGPSRPALERRLRGMPVTFLGTLSGERLATAFGALDVFVHTGTEETFGQTVQEAHASGLPVVAPRAGGPIDLVDSGVDGVLFDPDAESGPDSLAAAVRMLVGDPVLRARFGESGRRRVLGRSWDRLGEELVAHYSSAIAARRAADGARVV